MKQSSKVLILDVETAPLEAYTWGRWQQDVSMPMIKNDWYILNWSAKWLDEDFIYSDALHYHKAEYKKNPRCDVKILESLWKLLDEADYIIAHNGDRFDNKKIKARLLLNNFTSPSPYKTIDTLKIAKAQFALTSNRLTDLGIALGLGEKIDTGGFSLWKAIIEKQCTKSFDHMVAYCEEDVMLLERVYKKLAPWHKNHPTLYTVDGDNPVCSVCGSDKLVKNGFNYLDGAKVAKFKCKCCGSNLKARNKKGTLVKAV